MSPRGKTITIRTIYHNDDSADDPEFALQLRHHMLKLRWIGCEAEAAEVAERLKRLHLDYSGFSLAVPETD